MLDNSIMQKMIKYNELRSKVDDLHYQITKYLDENYNINEYERIYSMDGELPMYDWGTRYFDIALISQIVNVIETINNEVGEMPDTREIAEYLKGHRS
ncbi:MAG: hypothetical protein VZS44_11355 [Bacilli bacterium]|nr:hypothetical protein [Bacilli bacterium]